ncbi:MAG TPA: gfo/Idh/MocA family oxidoreductase [Phycisphaerales bacterium]|nr:gfo/Idh/MocA family oxidoreductase [Phycisphaerales bacterium]
MRPIGIGVIGCGGMGRTIVAELLRQNERLQVRGLFDPDKRSVKAALDSCCPGAKVYRDYRSLVASSDIDWVMIASWNCYHREQAIAAFEAGKDVFCQKPLATNLEDCLAMCRAWKKSGRMFSIGFTLRYSPHYRKIKELLDGGTIGDIVSMEFNETLDFNHGGYIMGDWRRLTKYAGTHLLEKCCHDIDLANWMVGSDASRVASFGGLDFFVPRNRKHIKRLGKNEKGLEAYRTWGGMVNVDPFTSHKDIVDNQVAIIEYANGVRATFHTNCNSGIPERRMYIVGTEGAIRADVIAGTIETRRIGFGTKSEKVDVGVSGGHGGGDAVLCRELAASMLDRVPPTTGLTDGLKSAAVCFALDKALETGRVVSLQSYWRRVKRVLGSVLHR